MNKWNLMTENIFRSEENVMWLRRRLMMRYGLHKKGGNLATKRLAYNFINEAIGDLVSNYDLRHLMNYSSPVWESGTEPDVRKQVKCLNAQFLQDKYEFINQNILDMHSGAHGQWKDRKIRGTVGVSDVYPASSRTQYFGMGSGESSNSMGIIATDNYKQRTPMGTVPPSNNPEGSWNRVSRPVQMRDDAKGRDDASASFEKGMPLQQSNFAYTYEFGEGDKMDGDVDVSTGTDAAAGSYHMNTLVGNNYYRILNNENAQRGEGMFNPNISQGADYEKLLFEISQGRVRSSDLSKRDTPKYYEQSIHSRPYQRDASEVLDGAEFENVTPNGRIASHGYDTESIHCRVNRRTNVCYNDKRNKPNRLVAFKD